MFLGAVEIKQPNVIFTDILWHVYTSYYTRWQALYSRPRIYRAADLLDILNG